jgi:hypothetical protein
MPHFLRHTDLGTFGGGGDDADATLALGVSGFEEEAHLAERGNVARGR